MPGEAIDFTSAAVLGALQGVTEFLPVSSSGHIALGAMLFDLEETPLTLSVVLHAGTLIATVGLFWKDIQNLVVETFKGLKAPKAFLDTDDGKTVRNIVLATLPTVVLGLGFHDAIESWGQVPAIVGAGLLASAVAVASTRFSGGEATTLTMVQALLVGLAQGMAIMPGLSRSGSTIAVAMLLGMRGTEAFRFSFLLSLPAVLGAVILELAKPGALAGIAPAVWVGGVISCVVGVVSLIALRRLVVQGRFWAFAFYLVPVGILAIAWRWIS